MRKKLVVLGVIASLIGTGVVIGAMVPAASQQPGTRFTVCDRNRGGFNKDVDLGKKGFSAGDQFLEVDTLRRPNTGDKVGRLVVRGSIVRVLRKRQDSFFIVDFTASFRNGKISGYGYTRFSKFQGEGGKFAITGGTGNRASAFQTRGLCGLQNARFLS